MTIINRDAVEQFLTDLLDTPEPFRHWLGNRRDASVGVTCSQSVCPLKHFVDAVLEIVAPAYMARVCGQEITIADPTTDRILCTLNGRAADGEYTWRYVFVKFLDEMYCDHGPTCGWTYVTGAQALAALDEGEAS